MRTLRAEGLLEHHNPFTGYPVLQYLPWGRGPDHQSAKVTHQVTTVVGPFTGRHCEKKKLRSEGQVYYNIPCRPDLRHVVLFYFRFFLQT